MSALSFANNNIINQKLSYKYDKHGNIIEVRSNNQLLAKYSYDSLSRIVREDNKEFQKTFIFSYDAGGNILNKFVYSFTLNNNLDNETIIDSYYYSYPATGWRDQLLSFNDQVFEYDSLGNPIVYRDKTLCWSHGRQLDKFDNVEFKYNSSGIRTSKSFNGNTTKYYLNGSKILAQSDTINTLYFHYGIDGVTGFNLDGIEYLYKKNIQNDIIGIYDTDGNEIVKYSYDAWGNHKTYVLNDTGYVDISLKNTYTENGSLNKDIAEINPFRYRSYYYDSETNLYYLNSRYYNPEIGRFINADDISVIDITKIEINGLNLYTYCLNNPVNEIDENGHLFLTLLFGFLLGTVIGFISSTITQGLTYGWDKINWNVVGLDTIFGGLSGLVGASPIGMLGHMLIAGTMSMSQYIGGQLIRGEELSTWSILSSFGIGLLFSASNGLLNGTMPGKNILKVDFVKQIQKQTINLFAKKGLNTAFTYFSKHIITKLLTGYTLDSIRTAAITGGINIISFWNEIGFKKLFYN